MSVTVNGTSGLVFGDGTIQGTAGFRTYRNKIINGNMDVNQRSPANASSTTVGYWVDRWAVSVAGTATTVTQQRIQDYPLSCGGWCLEVKATATGAVTEWVSRQYIEKQMIRDFANKPVVASFWVKSSRTGTHGIRFAIQDATATNTDNPTSFTVNAANTWEFKQVAFPAGSITTWNMAERPNVSGGFLDIGFKAGNSGPGFSTVTTGDSLRITRVQLELGTAATEFEDRPLHIEQDLCRRYFRRHGAGDSYAYVGNTLYFESASVAQMPIDITGMRTNQVTASMNALAFEGYGGLPTLSGAGLRGTNWIRCQFNASAAAAAGQATMLRTNNDVNGYFDITAEL
jgi:hypothetical protein